MTYGNKKLYLVSGLGADFRVFNNLKIPGVSTHVIEWMIPEPDESMQAYVMRLMPQIDEQQPVYLLGVSFGGIIAQELAKIIPCEKVFIVSSVKSREEYRPTLKLVRYMRVDRLLPGEWLKYFGKIFGPFFFSITSTQEKQLLRSIMNETEVKFLTWAINQIMSWQGDNDNQSIHIHGTSDRIFPVRYLGQYHSIDQGGHFMIYNQSEVIAKLINQELD